MKIVLVHGKPRSGKTFLIFLYGLLRAGRGEVMLHNFTVDHPNATNISPYDLIKVLDGGRVGYVRNICLQEVYGWFNSHRALSSVNDAESAVVFQSGKLGCNIFADSQLVGRVDSCLKDMADERFEADPLMCNRELCLGVRCPYVGRCCFRYYRLDLRFRDRNVRLQKPPVRIPFSFACKVWDRYGTYDVTKPVGWDDLLTGMEKTDSKLVNARVNSQVEMLLGRRDLLGRGKINKLVVESALLELGESRVFAGLVAVRLQMQL